MRRRRVVIPPQNTRSHPHLFSSQHEPDAYRVLVWLKETGQAVVAGEIATLLDCEALHLRGVLKALARTSMVFENRSHWPPKLSFNQTAYAALEDRVSRQPSIGWLDVETVEAMAEGHPLKERVFPCPGNLMHAPLLQDHFHVMPGGGQ